MKIFKKLLWTSLSVVFGCSNAPSVDQHSTLPEEGQRPLGSFTATIDLDDHTITFDQDSFGTSSRGLFGALSTQQNGIPLNGAADTVELVTIANSLSGQPGQVCPVGQFGGTVTLNHFYAASVTDLMVRLRWQVPVVGYGVLNSDGDQPQLMGLGFTDLFGTWTYPGNNTNRDWCFLDSGGSFRIGGDVFGDVRSAFDVTNFPWALPGGFAGGNLAFDNNGDLLSVSGNAVNGLYRTPRFGGGPPVLVNVGPVVPTLPMGVVYDPGTSSIYVSAWLSSNVSRVDPVTGAVTPLNSASAAMHDLEVVPPGFGNYSGLLMGGSNSGQILVYDQVAQTSVAFHTSSRNYTALVFDSSGTLYAADFNSSSIYIIDNLGNSMLFAGPLPAPPDGMTIDEDRGFLYTSSPGSSGVFQTPLAGGPTVPLVTATVEGGWAPNGIAYDGVNQLLMLTMNGAPELSHFQLP